MNEFYEAIAAFLEELRCDSMEREYAVNSEDMKEASEILEEKEKEFQQRVKQLPVQDKSLLMDYINAMEHAHFKEEQRAYYQGIMDGIQMLGGLGMIKISGNVKNLMDKWNK